MYPYIKFNFGAYSPLPSHHPVKLNLLTNTVKSIIYSTNNNYFKVNNGVYYEYHNSQPT